MGDEVWRFVRDLEALAVRSGMRVAELRVSGRGPAHDVTVTFQNAIVEAHMAAEKNMPDAFACAVM